MTVAAQGVSPAQTPPTPIASAAPAIQHLGIDEKAFGKGHRYATLLNDLDKGCVIDLIEERTEEATEKLLRELPATSRQGIAAVALAMASGRIRVLSVAPLVAEAIKRVRTGERARLRARALSLLVAVVVGSPVIGSDYQ